MWLRDTIKQISRGKSVVAGPTAEMYAWPYHETTKYSFYPVQTFKLKQHEWRLEMKQHSFSKHEHMFLRKCQRFWDRNCLDLRGTRTPNLRIHAECSNHLSYQGQTFAVPCFEHWLWHYRYFEVKLTFEILTSHKTTDVITFPRNLL